MMKKILIIYLFLKFYSCQIDKIFSNNSISVFKFANQIDKILIKEDNLILAVNNNLFLINSTNLEYQISKKYYSNLRSSFNKTKFFFKLNSISNDYILIGGNSSANCYKLKIKDNFIISDVSNCNLISPNADNSILLPIKMDEQIYYLIVYKDLNFYYEKHFTIFSKFNWINTFSKLKYSNNEFRVLSYYDKSSSISFSSEYDMNLIYLFDYGYYFNEIYQKYAFLLKTHNGITKLGRVCLNDISFESYTEITLTCKNNNQIYSYASTSYFGYTDYFLANKTGIRFYNKTLFVAFNKYDDFKREIKESDGTLLCAFTFEQLMDTYEYAINECYSGNTDETKLLNLKKFNVNDQCNQCTNYGNLTCEENCSNPFIYYKKSLEGYFYYRFENEIITSLITKSGEFFIGTSKGLIHRLKNDNDTEYYLENSFEFSKLNSSINPNPLIIANKIYFTSDNLLVEYKLESDNDLIKPEIKKPNYYLLIILYLLKILLIILLLGLIYKFCYKKRYDEKIIIQRKKISNSFIKPKNCDKISLDNVPIDCVKVLHEINSGHFGSVYKGVLERSDGQILEVAVKTLRDKVDENKKQNLIDEAKVMKNFKHENVLNLIGFHFDENNSPNIILPFLAKGDLLNYIRSEQNELTIRNLLVFAIQIGEGMQYLSSLKFVHRDLAARNCLLSNDLTIKISDFGLTKDIYESNYYRPGESCELPLCWMAIESLEKGYFTIQSDIWSYGVVLWELFTRGNRPYYGFNINKLINYLKNQNRLEKPEYCPDEIYELMLDCWNLDRSNRPTFTQIVEFLRTFINKAEGILENYSTLNTNYVNYLTFEYYNSKK